MADSTSRIRSRIVAIRRKDQLLQENGYFVLRFLAEDVGKDLDAVLDAIVRALARRRQSEAQVEPLKFVRRGNE